MTREGMFNFDDKTKTNMSEKCTLQFNACLGSGISLYSQKFDFVDSEDG
jgi:hypothetical protein